MICWDRGRLARNEREARKMNCEYVRKELRAMRRVAGGTPAVPANHLRGNERKNELGISLKRNGRSRGLLVIHHGCRFFALLRLILTVGAPHPDGFSGQTEDRAPVLQDQLQPGTLVHLRKIDAAEK